MKQFWNLLTENLGDDFAEDHELQQTVRDLSLAFTEGRSKLGHTYFEEPKAQAAYLAYFLPLNFMKVYTLLSTHAGVWPTKVDPARTQRWADLGCGPATATLAALAAFKNRYRKLDRLPPIHVDLIDTQSSALNLAEILVQQFAEKLALNVSIGSCAELPKTGPAYDLALAANILNELPAADTAASAVSGDAVNGRELLLRLWDATSNGSGDPSGVFLVLEPGHRVSSQRLIRFRQRLIKGEDGKISFLGPCPHTGKCPLYRTKHWCHFAEPVLDGRLIDLNLRIFKNPRSWLKFSYLLAKRDVPKRDTQDDPVEPTSSTRIFRAIGDLHPSGNKQLAIDLCQPNEKFALRLPSKIPPELRATLVRGATVWVSEDRQVTARPITKRLVTTKKR